MSQAPIAKSDATKQREREEEFLRKYNFWLRYNNPNLPASQEATLEGARVSRTCHLKTFSTKSKNYRILGHEVQYDNLI
jgi:hypothetical protein